MRPDTSRTALIGKTDDLADAVERRERVLLDQLRGGKDMLIGDLEFRAELRSKFAAGGATGVLKEIGPYFRGQETRRMVVLGKAGAGKTVLAVRLVLDQLQHRTIVGDAVRAREPVAVRVNAAGWDGTADFTAWLANQLAIDYGLNPRVARAMVDTDRILPVLDGLDEMDPLDAQPVLARATLDRLNKPPWRNRAVVITCRSRVYDAIRELCDHAGLQFATTVTLQPLSAEDIYIYLEQYRDEHRQAEAKWAPVTDQLEHTPDGILATALGTPWLLSLAAIALKRGGHETATKLAACRDTAQVRELLFATLIPAAVDATPDTKHTHNYTEENVAGWLHTLADHLEQRRTKHSGGSQVALDQIWQLAGTGKCRALQAVLGALIWLAAGLALALSLGTLMHENIRDDLMAGLIFGTPVGIVTGLWYGLAAVRADIGLQRSRPVRRFAWRGSGVPKRFAWRVPGRSRWQRGVKRGIVVGLPASLFSLLLLVLPGANLGVLARLLGLAFALALVFGLLRGLGTTAEERLALGQDAGRIIHDDHVSALMGGLIWLTSSATLLLLYAVQLRIDNAHTYNFIPHFGEQPPHTPDQVHRFLSDASVFDVRSYPDGTISYVQMERVPVSAAAVLKDWHSWLPALLPVGLALGLLLALLFASLSAVASGRYAIASLLFGFTGRFPRRPAVFLEWARNAGLLRVTGIAYQFRHDTYQQWLTEGGGSRDVKVRSDPAADARSG
jgi:hypothetical protein